MNIQIEKVAYFYHKIVYNGCNQAGDSTAYVCL